MKEQDALGKLCPIMSRPVNNNEGITYLGKMFCEGSDCMAWIETDEGATESDHQDPAHGYCNLVQDEK